MNKKRIFRRIFIVLLAALMMIIAACGTGNVDTDGVGSDSSAYDAEDAGETDRVSEADNVDKTESGQLSSETGGQPALSDDESAGEASEQSSVSDDGSAGDDGAGNDGAGDNEAGTAGNTATSEMELPIYGENYYDVQNVVLYLKEYGELPPNYITKSEAQALGWEGGSVEEYQEGAAIGGDKFGNREGLLPSADGRTYTECDIDTNGRDSRGAKRLVFSNDGLYYYTMDHYESFQEVTITEENEVVW